MHIIAAYKCRITSPGIPASTVKSSKDTRGVTITLSSRAIVPAMADILITAEPLVVVVYPLSWPLLVGEYDVPACGPPASFSIHLVSSAVTPAGSVHKSRGDNVVHMWVQLKRWCVCSVYECYRGGIVVMDVIWRLLCVNMIWERVFHLF